MFHLPKQVLNFTEEFYAPPVVIVTVNHFYNNRNLYSVKPENNALNTWIEVSFKYTLKINNDNNMTVYYLCGVFPYPYGSRGI